MSTSTYPLISYCNFVDRDDIIKKFEITGSPVIPMNPNLVDFNADKNHAEIPKIKLFSRPITGRSIGEKLLELRFYLFEKKAHAIIIYKDEIAWLFNLTPSSECNAIITKKEAFLYSKKMPSPSEKGSLDSVQVRPFSDLLHDCTILNSQLQKYAKIIITEKAYLVLKRAFGKDHILREDYSFISSRSASQTKSERDATRACYLRDGAAITSFLAWFDNRVNHSGGTKLDITEAATKLDHYRNTQEHYMGLRSFSINMVSMPSTTATCGIYQKNIIDTSSTLFISSDGQYLDGNAIYAGTFHFKSPNLSEKRCYTRILQAHIAMNQSIFPRGTTGDIVDAFGRQALWKEGLDTIASFLNSNDEDDIFSLSSKFDRIPLAAGMVLSISPHYKDDLHTMCIRNTVITKQVDTSCKSSFSLGLENISFVPLCRRLIQVDLLSPQERKWINSYHEECFNKLNLLVDEKTVAWLKKETWPI